MSEIEQTKTINLDDLYCICETSTGITHIGILLDFEFYGISLFKPKMIMIDEHDQYLDEPMFVGSSDGYITYSSNTPYTLFTPSDYFKSLYVNYDLEQVVDEEIDLDYKFIISNTVQ